MLRTKTCSWSCPIEPHAVVRLCDGKTAVRPGVHCSHWRVPANGPGAFQQFVGVFYAAFSGFRHDVEDMLVEDDRVAFRAVARATHTAPFMGIPATGRSIAVPMIGLARMRGVDDAGDQGRELVAGR
jgi:SnoaL-like polyketide cyclase